jgi:hypothetical protein
MRENKKYLAYIRTKPCIYCGRPSEPHHIRTKLFIPPKYRGGTGLKSYDVMTLPLCHTCHTDVHEFRKTIENPHYYIMELMGDYIGNCTNTN